MNPSIPIWKSKTFWVNAIGALLEIGQLLSGTTIIPHQYVVLGMAILNIVLRLITNQPTTLTQAGSDDVNKQTLQQIDQAIATGDSKHITGSFDKLLK